VHIQQLRRSCNEQCGCCRGTVEAVVGATTVPLVPPQACGSNICTFSCFDLLQLVFHCVSSTHVLQHDCGWVSCLVSCRAVVSLLPEGVAAGEVLLGSAFCFFWAQLSASLGLSFLLLLGSGAHARQKHCSRRHCVL
jgi:hypothetical protein